MYSKVWTFGCIPFIFICNIFGYLNWTNWNQLHFPLFLSMDTWKPIWDLVMCKILNFILKESPIFSISVIRLLLHSSPFSPSLLLMDACRFFDVMYLYGFLALEFPWHDNLWSNFDFSELHFILFINKIFFIYIMLQGKQPCSLSGVQNARKILVIHNKPRLWAWPFILGIM